MKVLFAAVAAASLCSALNIAPRSSSPRAVGLEISRRAQDSSTIPARDRARLLKRQQTVEQTLDNLETLYFANITLGTPAQSLQMHIDTGSSDLWVNTASSALCRSSSKPCQGGTYDSSASSTYKLISDKFNISYVDGSGAVGDYVSDSLEFGGVTLPGFQFGVGTTSTSNQGVLGIGYAINEVQVGRANEQAYPNLPIALVNAGHIKSNAYSLWLNDLDASTGTILFGGVNTAKYQGELATVPVIQSSGSYYTLSIAMTAFGINGSTQSFDSLPAGVLLDSGSTLTYLPNDITTAVYNKMNAVYLQDVGAAYAPCSMMNQDWTFDYEFSGKRISVPMNEMLLDTASSSGQPLTFQNGEKACLFGIAPSQGGVSVLGDTFLRSAYVVYDLVNNEISLAQTVFNATANDVREIGTGTSPVPNASPVANPVTNVAGPTGGRNGEGNATPTSFLSSDAPNSLVSRSSSFVAIIASVVFAIVAS